MTDTLTAGSILIEKHTHLPEAMRLQSEPDSSGWVPLNGTRPTFEKEVQEAGWTFFFMAGEIRATAFGFDRQKMVRTALQRLMTNVKSHHCNSIEITQVTAKSFLKVPYVTLSAHARHLQKGSTFAGPGAPSLI
jgi:hypothetical protein